MARSGTVRSAFLMNVFETSDCSAYPAISAFKPVVVSGHMFEHISADP